MTSLMSYEVLPAPQGWRDVDVMALSMPLSGAWRATVIYRVMFHFYTLWGLLLGTTAPTKVPKFKRDTFPLRFSTVFLEPVSEVFLKNRRISKCKFSYMTTPMTWLRSECSHEMGRNLIVRYYKNTHKNIYQKHWHLGL